MSLNISLPPQVEAKLRQKAEAVGQPLGAYAAQLLEQAACSPTVDEILAPFRAQVAESGLSDQELDAFFADVRQKAYDDKPRPA